MNWKKTSKLELFEALEMPLAHILGEMESIGVQVDVDRLKKMGEELSAKLAEYEKKSTSQQVKPSTLIHQSGSV